MRVSMPKCGECDGRGTVFPHRGDANACPTCLGSGCVLCAECKRPPRVADALAHDGVPLCNGHLDIYYPTRGGIDYV